MQLAPLSSQLGKAAETWPLPTDQIAHSLLQVQAPGSSTWALFKSLTGKDSGQ